MRRGHGSEALRVTDEQDGTDTSSSIRLTHWVGTAVTGAEGTGLGTVDDVIVSAGSASNASGVIVASGSARTRLTWEDLTLVDGRFDRVTTPLASLGGRQSWRRGDDVPLADGEICLVRDVLDGQIVDLLEHRIVRVGDVVLERMPSGEVVVAAVEVGIRSVLDRLGLHRISSRFSEQAVAWTDLHLLSRRGHRAQLTATNPNMHRLDATSLAHLLAHLSTETSGDVLRSLPTERSADVLHAANDEVGGRLLSSLSESEADELLTALPTERAARYRRVLHQVHLPRRHFSRSSPRHHPRWRRSDRSAP